MARQTNPMVKFLAGFGTGYMQSEKERYERQRQDERDRMAKEEHRLRTEADQLRIDEAKQRAANRDRVEGALADVDTMRAGSGLVDKAGDRYDTSEQAYRDRLTANGVDSDTAARTAPIYAAAASAPGASGWASDGFGEHTGVLRTTTQADIHTAEAAAYAKGGADFRKERMEALRQAASARYAEGVRRIMNWQPGQDVKAIQDVYDSYADGYNLQAETRADGKFYTWVTDAQGRKSSERTYESPDAFKRYTVMHLIDPNNAHGHITNMMRWIDQEQDDRKLSIAEQKIAAGERMAAEREDRRDQRQQISIDAMEARQSRQLQAIGERQDRTGDRVTATQKANNAEIQLARKRLSGMSAEEVRAKTQQFLPNGRDNPNYDPMISHAYHTANQRMVGDDPQFDRYLEDAQPLKLEAGAPSRGTPAERFKADPSMRGNTLGKFTGKGWEVRDSGGRHIGYWQ